MSELGPVTCCLPCLRGAHSLCRHYPDGRRFERGDKSKPCACEASKHTLTEGTCCANVQGDWESHRCGKPAKTTVPASYTWGRDATETEVPACGVHGSAYRRRTANNAARNAQWAAERAERQRDEETARSIDEALERLRPKLEALGIRPDTAVRAKNGKAQGIMLPAEAVERIVRDALQLDEIMGGA